MSAGLLDPPAGEQLCVFLLRDEGEEEEVRKREVGCQWESPEEEKKEKKEVGCQSESAERRDAAVQVDLSWRHSGSSAMLLQCFAVRPDGRDGGALLQHCTPPRTRTRTIQHASKHQNTQNPRPPHTRSRTQRGRPPIRRRSGGGSSSGRPASRNQRQRKASPDQQEEEEVEQEEQEEEVVEEDTGDPTWTPPEADVPHPSPSAPDGVELDSESQNASLHVVKLEPDSTMCDVCGKVMKNKSSLARHSFIHTGKKPYACHLCELRFNRRDNLQHHLTRLHPGGVPRLEKQRQETAWLCAVCGKTFSCRSRLKTHEVIHSGVKPFRCQLCPKAYMRTNDLEHHTKSVHVDGGGELQRSGSLLCDLCGKEFRCRSQLAAHFQTHTGERPHLCDICGRKFGRQYQLKRHKILVHANRAVGAEDPSADAAFSCGVCGKRMKTEALLAAHSRIHTGDKPHRCGLCLRSFQRAACLKQHHARVHLKVRESAHAAARRASSVAEKTFPCPVCSKTFRFRSLLASHALIHSEARPHACDFCSRSFRRLSHLKRHREVVHSNGARPLQSFVCHICGKDKKCRSQLARHVIIHTGERPFPCELCTARFNRHGNLQQHRRRMHGVAPPPLEEAPPILFDEDDVMAPAYKQEETVVAVDDAAEAIEVATGDEADAT
ncbi:zinc finger protein 83-like [Scomber scombrus]|uniref:zinc finger protein 83-like n=1 Tax=Scomber scombrus TaxID=13677 RepID=UPI002DD7D43A|nr:zinc finger protein 83-like [Scomber scombrus]